MKQTVLLIIIIFHSFAFYLMSYLMSIFYPRLFSDSYEWAIVPRSVYFLEPKTPRELVEEREQRTKENETKGTHIKEKEEELKKLDEKFLMAISSTIDKWVEHANDEGWLTSIV